MQSCFPTALTLSEICLKKFNQLPKTGKPSTSEWTILSCIIQHDNENDETKVVAIGAGTKCIGKSQLCPRGLIINDSHAEVLARRAFLRYIYEELFINDGKVFLFDKATNRFRLKESITFHFYNTEIPCGDACINLDEFSKQPTKCNDKSSIDRVYTGAKLLNTSVHQSMSQIEGAIRNKPGRGDTTLSNSCSDKLSKWVFLGVQGALLDSVLFSPIYFETINFDCEINIESLKRSLYKRWESKNFSNNRFHLKKPEIRVLNNNNFTFKRSFSKSPSPNGLIWCELRNSFWSYEVSVNGKRQGVTAQNRKSKKASLQISKIILMQNYCNLLNSKPELLTEFSLTSKDIESITYSQLKANAMEYQLAWNFLKESVFLQWSLKPKNLYNFTLYESNIECNHFLK